MSAPPNSKVLPLTSSTWVTRGDQQVRGGIITNGLDEGAGLEAMGARANMPICLATCFVGSQELFGSQENDQRVRRTVTGVMEEEDLCSMMSARISPSLPPPAYWSHLCHTESDGDGPVWATCGQHSHPPPVEPRDVDFGVLGGPVPL